MGIKQHDVENIHDRVGYEILEGKHRHIRRQRDPGGFGIDARHGPHAPHRVFQILNVVFMQSSRYAHRRRYRPGSVGVKPDSQPGKGFAQSNEGVDFFIGRHHTVFVLQGLEAIFLDHLFRKGHHLILVGDLALPLVIGVAVKEISGKSNFFAEFAADDFADRFAQDLALQIKACKFEPGKTKNVAEQF